MCGARVKELQPDTRSRHEGHGYGFRATPGETTLGWVRPLHAGQATAANPDKRPAATIARHNCGAVRHNDIATLLEDGKGGCHALPAEPHVVLDVHYDGRPPPLGRPAGNRRPHASARCAHHNNPGRVSDRNGQDGQAQGGAKPRNVCGPRFAAHRAEQTSVATQCVDRNCRSQGAVGGHGQLTHRVASERVWANVRSGGNRLRFIAAAKQSAMCDLDNCAGRSKPYTNSAAYHGMSSATVCHQTGQVVQLAVGKGVHKCPHGACVAHASNHAMHSQRSVHIAQHRLDDRIRKFGIVCQFADVRVKVTRRRGAVAA